MAKIGNVVLVSRFIYFPGKVPLIENVWDIGTITDIHSYHNFSSNSIDVSIWNTPHNRFITCVSIDSIKIICDSINDMTRLEKLIYNLPATE